MSGTPSETEKSAPANDPFITNQVACPICAASRAQRRLKSHLFIEQDRDIDLHPRKILRKKSGLEDYNLLIYYMWQCPSCHFTAGFNLFPDPVKNSSLPGFKFQQAIKQNLFNDPKTVQVVTLLSGSSDGQDRDYISAVRLFWLAIYLLGTDEEISVKTAVTLGRYNLRLAWLYREIAGDPQAGEKCLAEITSQANALLTLWPDVPSDESKAMQAAADNYRAALQSPGLVESELDEVQLVLLIARIHLKMGQLALGRKYWGRASTISKKFEYSVKALMSQAEKARNTLRAAKRSEYKLLESKEQQLKDEIKRLDGSAVEMDSQSRRMRNLVQEVRDVLYDLEDEEFQRQTTKAKAILSRLGDQPPDRLRELLAREGFREQVINNLVPEKKSKGLFRLFR